MSMVHSFIEDSTWDRNDELKTKRGTVVFQLAMNGESDRQFTSDFGLFYDPDDSGLIGVLSESFPGQWDQYVFWKDQADASIKLIDPLDDTIQGRISVRRGLNSNLSGQVDWTNVVSMVFARESAG